VNLLTKVSPLGQIAVFLLLLSVLGITAAHRSGFDVPLKKTVVDFGRSPYYLSGKVRNKLSCYLYPTLMVKEYDEGQKGSRVAVDCSGRERSWPDMYSVSCHGGTCHSIPRMERVFQWCQGESGVLQCRRRDKWRIAIRHLRFQNRDEDF